MVFFISTLCCRAFLLQRIAQCSPSAFADVPVADPILPDNNIPVHGSNLILVLNGRSILEPRIPSVFEEAPNMGNHDVLFIVAQPIEERKAQESIALRSGKSVFSNEATPQSTKHVPRMKRHIMRGRHDPGLFQVALELVAPILTAQLDEEDMPVGLAPGDPLEKP